MRAARSGDIDTLVSMSQSGIDVSSAHDSVSISLFTYTYYKMYIRR